MSNGILRPSAGWTLDEGVGFIRRYENAAWNRFYNLSLGGSVLLRCRSDKDLDIFCTPACWRDRKDTATQKNFLDFCLWLRELFPTEREQTTQDWNGQMFKYACTLPDGRWIDWFIVIGKHGSEV